MINWIKAFWSAIKCEHGCSTDNAVLQFKLDVERGMHMHCQDEIEGLEATIRGLHLTVEDRDRGIQRLEETISNNQKVYEAKIEGAETALKVAMENNKVLCKTLMSRSK